ncbi:MAG TPA: hypothetical protein VIF09_27750 [Polyangiaceae bacterium]
MRAEQWYGAWTTWTLLVAALGCHAKPTDASAALDAQVKAAAADSTAEVAPPPALVAADPEIPLNEAVVGATPVASEYSAPVAPPAPVEEERPASPDPGDVWVPGYWWWSTPLARYVWVTGAWRNPPPGQVWTPGEWVSSPAGTYVRVPGFWGTPAAPRPAVADVAPPPPPLEAPRPSSPGIGYEWTPGYYAFRGGNFDWVAGSWARPPRPGLGWVEPRYVGVGGRFHFQPGRWDFGEASRGVAYRPDVNVLPGARFRPEVVPASVVEAHARYVGSSSRALAQGGTRMPGGGVVFRGARGLPRPGSVEGRPVNGLGRPGNMEPRAPGGPGRGNEPRERR